MCVCSNWHLVLQHSNHSRFTYFSRIIDNSKVNKPKIITQINKNFRYNIPILTLERCKRCAHPHLSRSFHRFLNCQRPHYWIRRNTSTKCMMLAC